jgi:hypothetical protein
MKAIFVIFMTNYDKKSFIQSFKSTFSLKYFHGKLFIYYYFENIVVK